MTQSAPVGNLETRARVHNAISAASVRTGVDFDYLYNQARIESSLKPDARAKTSSATGLYQFTRQTWLSTVKEHGAAHGLGWAADAIGQSSNGGFYVSNPNLRAQILNMRNSPEAASNMAAAFASDNGAFLHARVGRSPEPVDLYLAHFLGPAGAAKFLTAHATDPDAAAAPLFPAAAAANRGIFFGSGGRVRTLDEIRNIFAQKLGEDALQPVPPAIGAPSSFPPPAWQSPVPAAPHASSSDAPRPLQILSIEPMPERLSLEFAHRAYQRLARMGGGAEA